MIMQKKNEETVAEAGGNDFNEQEEQFLVSESTLQTHTYEGLRQRCFDEKHFDCLANFTYLKSNFKPIVSHFHFSQTSNFFLNLVELWRFGGSQGGAQEFKSLHLDLEN